MIILPENQYKKALPILQEVPFNNLFARAVVRRSVSGKVYADNETNPEVFYIVHPYGMSLLIGNWQNKTFIEQFKKYIKNDQFNRTKADWMQAYPAHWNSEIEKLQLEHNLPIKMFTRVNFKFNQTSYLQKTKPGLAEDIKVVRTDELLFSQMQGTVVPLNFWNNADDFFKNGYGFSCLYQNQLAATAYSAFLLPPYLEIGIETAEAFRGKGLAQIACSALIEYCLANHLEPVWACRKDNTGSYILAQKLGFKPLLELPYYKLDFQLVN
jgi:hypothetical protein